MEAELRIRARWIDNMTGPAKASFAALSTAAVPLGRAATSAVGGALSRLSSGIEFVRQRALMLGPALSTLGSRMIRFGSTAQMIGMRLMTSLTVPLLGLGAVAVKTFLDFDKAMRKTAAAAGTTQSMLDKNYRAMYTAAIESSKVTIYSATESASALYELVSAGMSAAQSAKMLTPTLKFAEAAGLEVGDAAQYATSQYHLWSSAGYDLNKIFDITATAVQKSQAHFSDFTHNVELSGIFAKNAGQPFEELAAAIMVASNRGAALGTIGFNLRQSFTQMMNPSKKAKDVMKALGISYYDAQGKMKPLSAILETLRAKTKGMTNQQRDLTLQTLFNVRAGGVMRTLLEGTNEEYAKYLKMLEKSGGSMRAMAKIIEESPSAAFQMTINRLQAIGITIGAHLLPMVIELGNQIEKLGKWFNSLNKRQQLAIMYFGLLLAAIGPVVKIIGAFSTVLGLPIKLLGSMLTILMSPMGLLVAFGQILLVMGLLNGALHIFRNRIAIGKTFESLGRSLGPVYDKLKDVWNILKDPAWATDKKLQVKLTAALDDLWKEIVDWWNGTSAKSKIKPQEWWKQNAKLKIPLLVDDSGLRQYPTSGRELFQQLGEQIGGAIAKGMVQGINFGLNAAIEATWKAMGGGVGAAGALIGAALGALTGNPLIAGAAALLGNRIALGIQAGIIDFWKDFVASPFVTAVTTAIEAGINALMPNAAQWGRMVGGWIWDGLVSTFPSLPGIVARVKTFMLQGVNGTLQDWYNGGSSLGSRLIDGVIDGILNNMGPIGWAIKALKDYITGNSPKELPPKDKTGLMKGITTGMPAGLNPIGGKAWGGFANSPTVFGEAGLEVAIPLTSSKANRALSLWMQTGKMLGALPSSPSITKSSSGESSTKSVQNVFSIRELKVSVPSGKKDEFIDEMQRSASRANVRSGLAYV